MVQIFIQLALRINRGDRMGKSPLSDGFAIDHSHNPVDRHLCRNARPVEGPHKRLRQGQTAGLYHDMIGLIFPGQKLFHCWDEVIGDRATDAAIGQLHHVFFAAGFITAALQYIAIHAKIAKLIDDQGDPAALCILQHMADEGGFTRAKKAGNDCCGDFRDHVSIPCDRAWSALRRIDVSQKGRF